MTDQDESTARTRFFVISLTRLIGGILVMLGMMVLLGYLAWPQIVGYALLLVGLIDTFVIPQVLIRKWRSPKG